MNTGVLYSFTGLRSADLLAVSLWTLRKHYSGPVVVMAIATNRPDEHDSCGSDTPWSIANRMASDKRLDIQLARIPRDNDCRFPHHLSKVYSFLETPFDNTLFLDADTVVQANPSPLLGNPLTCTMVNGLKSYSDREQIPCIHNYRYARNLKPVNLILRRMVNRARSADLPLINTGVFGFTKNHPALYEIHHLCFGLRYRGIHDEVAMNLIAPRYMDDITFADHTWNSLIDYNPRPQDIRSAKIVHMSFNAWRRRAHARKFFSYHLQEVLASNVAGIQDWIGRFNPDVNFLVDHYIRGLNHAQSTTQN